MRVLSLLEHLTRGDRKPDRPGKAPNHFDTNRIVAAVKGEPFNGYSRITVAGTTRILDETRPDLALEWAAQRLGHRIDKEFKGKIVLVPIPGHECTSSFKVAAHRVCALASRISDWLQGAAKNVEARVAPLLHWARVAKSAHKQGGTRDPNEIVRNYRVHAPLRIVKDCVVLIDDVVTTGAHLMAAHRFLRDEGFAVQDLAFAVARTVHEKGVAAKSLILEYPRRPDTEDDAPF